MRLHSSLAAFALLDQAPAKNEIVQGSTLPFTGLGGQFGTATLECTRLCVEQVNAQGSAHARRPPTPALDDGDSTAKGMAYAMRLVEQDNAFLLFGIVDTLDRFVAAMEMLTEYDLSGAVIGFDKNRRRGRRHVELSTL